MCGDAYESKMASRPAWSPQVPAVWRERLRRKPAQKARASKSAPPSVCNFREKVAERLAAQGRHHLQDIYATTALHLASGEQMQNPQHRWSDVHEVQDNNSICALDEDVEDLGRHSPEMRNVEETPAEMQDMSEYSSSSLELADAGAIPLERNAVLTWHCIEPPRYDGQNHFRRESMKSRRRKAGEPHFFSTSLYAISPQDGLLSLDLHFSILRVCIHLLARDLCTWGAASRHYNSMTSAGFLWRRLLQQRLGANFMSYATCVRFSARGWKHAYRACVHAIDSMYQTSS